MPQKFYYLLSEFKVSDVFDPPVVGGIEYCVLESDIKPPIEEPIEELVFGVLELFGLVGSVVLMTDEVVCDVVAPVVLELVRVKVAVVGVVVALVVLGEEVGLIVVKMVEVVMECGIVVDDGC